MALCTTAAPTRKTIVQICYNQIQAPPAPAPSTSPPLPLALLLSATAAPDFSRFSLRGILHAALSLPGGFRGASLFSNSFAAFFFVWGRLSVSALFFFGVGEGFGSFGFVRRTGRPWFRVDGVDVGVGLRRLAAASRRALESGPRSRFSRSARLQAGVFLQSVRAFRPLYFPASAQRPERWRRFPPRRHPPSRRCPLWTAAASGSTRASRATQIRGSARRW